MKRLKTILKEIDDLERELYTNYSVREILNEMDSIESTDYSKFYGISDGLLSVIYDGAYNDIELEDCLNKEAFISYEKVRQSGEYNMITDAILAAEAANLSMEQYINVQKNYSNLKNQFNSELSSI